jgi:putative NIF3 family GTP cyclohydrolase 1 type 2
MYRNYPSGDDAILIHHGYCWRGEDARVIGAKYKRLKLHLASKSGVAYLTTERYGMQAPGRHLAEHFGLQHQFVDIDNPV